MGPRNTLALALAAGAAGGVLAYRALCASDAAPAENSAAAAAAAAAAAGPAAATVQIHGECVPVTAARGVDLQRCLSATIFRDWVASMDAQFQVRGVEFQSLDLFGPGRVGFIKLKADVVHRDSGAFIPGICLLRGGAVAMLVVIKCAEDPSELYTVLTVQARAPTGCYATEEIPAGMLDGSGNFAGVAAKELEEETGLVFGEGDLIDMSKLAFAPGVKGVVPSGGGCDEVITVFLARSEMPRAQIEALQGKCTGELAEGESITLKVLPYDELWHVHDAKALSAIALFEKLRARGDVTV